MKTAILLADVLFEAQQGIAASLLSIIFIVGSASDVDDHCKKIMLLNIDNRVTCSLLE